MGSGVAFRIRSEELGKLREDLATEFHGLLSAQDAAGWIPHVTIQSKVAASEARELRHRLERSFRPRPIRISGLQLLRYVEGIWEPLGRWRFRSVS